MLIGLAKQKAKGYKFTSVEVKDIDFRFDGIFAPEAVDDLIYCVEAQFKKEDDFYRNYFGKIFNFLQKHKPVNDWRAIVFYPSRAVDTGVHPHYRELFGSGRLQRIYLTELPDAILEKFPLNLLKIIIDSKRKVLTTAEKIIQQLPEQVPDEKQQEIIVELLINLLFSKLPQMSREEIEKMFEPLLSDVKKSRAYREIAQEEKRKIAIALLKKKLSPELISEVTGLSAKQIHALTKDLAGRKN